MVENKCWLLLSQLGNGGEQMLFIIESGNVGEQMLFIIESGM